MDNLIAKHHMSTIYAGVDDSVVSLWIETAGLILFMSLVFALVIGIF